MATKLVLRNTTKAASAATLGLSDGIVYDMLAAQFGSSTDTLVTSTTAGGTDIQCTKTAGGSTVAWISGRVPAGGFTLTTSDVSVWGVESNMNANAAGRIHIYKWSPGSPPTVTELGASPFSDNAEVGTSTTELTWACNVTDTAFAEDDRILIRLYLTNAPTLTMGGGFTVTFTFNGADAATGDSFFNINETVTFKGENYPLSTTLGTYALTGSDAAFVRGKVMSTELGAYALTGSNASLLRTYVLSVEAGSYGVTGNTTGLLFHRRVITTLGEYALTGNALNLLQARKLVTEIGSYALTGNAAGVLFGRRLISILGAYELTGSIVDLRYTPGGGAAYTLTVEAGSYILSGSTSGLLFGHILIAALGSYSLSGNAATLTRQQILIIESGVYSLTGSTVTLSKLGLISPAVRQYKAATRVSVEAKARAVRKASPSSEEEL